MVDAVLDLVRDSEELQSGRPARRARVLRTIDTYLDGIADIVRDGQRSGAIRRDVDPATVALMVLGIIQPAALPWQMSGGRLDLAGHADHAWQLVRRAIVAG